MIGYSAFNFTNNFNYPSWEGLIPTIGTVLLIKTSIGVINEYFLNNRMMIYLGQISYAMYLFHNSFIFYADLKFFGTRYTNTLISFGISVLVTKMI